MPGENFSCVGCHEEKNSAPLASTGARRAQAMLAGTEELVPFHGDKGGFSYEKHVQPVLDKHCISCHSNDSKNEKAKAFVLTKEPMVRDTQAKKKWALSYYNLTKARPGPDPSKYNMNGSVWKRHGAAKADEPNKYISYYTRFELMGAQAPYRAGSIVSPMIQMLEKGHHKVKLSQADFDKLHAWIDLNIPYSGSYDESNIWSGTEKKWYAERVNKRKRNEDIEKENINQFIKDGQP